MPAVTGKKVVGKPWQKGHDPRRNIAGTAQSPHADIHKIVRRSIIQVYEALGGTKGMTDWARENPTEFYRMYARLIPREYMGTSAQEIAGGLFDLLQSRAKRSIELKPEPVTIDAEAAGGP